MPNCHTFGVIMGSNVCRVSNAICIIRAGMNETKLKTILKLPEHANKRELNIALVT